MVVAQSCPTLCDPTDYSTPGSSVYGILNPFPLPHPITYFSCVNLYEFDHNSPPLTLYRDLRVGHMVKNLPAVQETQVQSLGWKILWRRKWQPTPVFLPGESHGQRSLAGYSPWGHKESDPTEQLTPPTL